MTFLNALIKYGKVEGSESSGNENGFLEGGNGIESSLSKDATEAPLELPEDGGTTVTFEGTAESMCGI